MILDVRLKWVGFHRNSVDMGLFLTLIEDCAKDGGEEFLPRCIAFELQIFDDSIAIRLGSGHF